MANLIAPQSSPTFDWQTLRRWKRRTPTIDNWTTASPRPIAFLIDSWGLARALPHAIKFIAFSDFKENLTRLLDLDETLIYATEEKLGGESDFIVGQYFVYKRPFLNEFLEFCFKNYI